MPPLARPKATTTSSSATAAPNLSALWILVTATAVYSPAMRPLPLLFLARQTIRPAEGCKAATSKAFDQSSVYQQSIEPPCFGAAGASVEQAVATFQNILLLGKRRVEWHAGGLLHQKRQIRRI